MTPEEFINSKGNPESLFSSDEDYKEALWLLKQYDEHLQAEVKNLPIHDVSKPLVGQSVIITDCIEGHKFAMGEEVTIIESHDNITFKAKRENGDYWWITKNEFTAC